MHVCMCSSAIMHSWLQYLAPHIAHWCPSNGKVDTQCRLQRLRVLNKSRFGLLSARVMFNHCSIAQCSCDPSCLLLQLLHTPWFDTPRTPIFVDASLTFKRTTALLFHCHHCFLGYNSIQFNSIQFRQCVLIWETCIDLSIKWSISSLLRDSLLILRISISSMRANSILFLCQDWVE